MRPGQRPRGTEMEDANVKKSVIKMLALALCLALAVSLAGCGKGDADPMKKDGALLKVDGHEISFDEVVYYFMNIRASQTQNGETTTLEDVLATLDESLQADYGVDKWVNEQGVELTEDELAMLDSSIQNSIAYLGGEEAFREAVKTFYCTPEMFAELQKKNYQQELAITKWFGENYAGQVQDLFRAAADDYVRVQHVLIKFADTTEGADHSAELAKAQEVYEKAMNGEDFAKLIEEYNEDPGATEQGYTFTYGKMVKPFEEASFAMSEGEISEPVETSYGYHVIKKLALDYDYIGENAYDMCAELAQGENESALALLEEANAALQEALTPYQENVKVEHGKQYGELTLESFDAMFAPAGSDASGAASDAASEPAGSEADGE